MPTSNLKHDIKNEILISKINNVLADYYTKYSIAKEKGRVSILNDKFKKQIEQVFSDYEIYKERNKN